MPAGKAIVASRSEQVAELPTNDETAILIEPASRDELARAIERLLATAICGWGSASAREAEREHGWALYVR
jgi:glycosyltransferase involved in cell wall biosynthesis